MRIADARKPEVRGPLRASVQQQQHMQACAIVTTSQFYDSRAAPVKLAITAVIESVSFRYRSMFPRVQGSGFREGVVDSSTGA
jgi:hypothetical protein